MVNMFRAEFGKSYSYQSLVFLMLSFIFQITDSEAEHSRNLNILRERIQRLESRLSEDISLIREEFYNEISALGEEDDLKGSAEKLGVRGDAELSEQGDFLVKFETLKNALLTKLKAFDDGRKQEKRIRREIQDEICELKTEKADAVKSISVMSERITTTIGELVEKVHVSEKLDEIVELLESLNTQLMKHNRIKSEDNNERIKDCSDWLWKGYTRSGVYTVFPETVWRPIEVYCDMETLGGGWTVFQRRQDGSENFNRKWMDYTFGFGNLSGEFWLGNEFIHRLTSHAPHELHIELEDFEDDRRYAAYGMFSVGSAAELFKLSVNFFTGNVSDSLKPNHNGLQFSTSDHGPSTVCADTYKGGWWYSNCHAVNINGLYLKGEHKSYADGISWKDWRGYHYSLKKTEMKFRPH